MSIKALRNLIRETIKDIPKTDIEENDLKDVCWDGYEAIGFKEKDGKRVPNCVPKKEYGKAKKRKSKLSEGLAYHIQARVPLVESIYRPGSKSFFDVFLEARQLYRSNEYVPCDSFEKELLESNIGEWGTFNGEEVPLDFPMLSEAEYKGRSVELNKPMRSSGPTKYKVYVKNDKGNVIQVNFGDQTGGLSVKLQDPEARKSFAARHQCEKKNDKTKAGYWSCRLPRYAEQLGLKPVSAQWW